MARQPGPAKDEAAEARRAQVVPLRRQGKSTRQIARQLGVTHTTIQKDLRILREEWRARIAQDYDAHMAEQFERLNAVHEHAWQGYEKSCTDEKPEGNPSLLEIARKAAIDIGKMIGLADPVEFQGKRVQEGDDAGAGKVDIVEVVVKSREELNEVTNENGVISMSDYQRMLSKRLEAEYQAREAAKDRA